ncbi:MAG: hypothetical protein JXA20_02375 [Spirochaetes bacterium]|nr:hypothetical protein [Spirochaetota bacterium]
MRRLWMLFILGLAATSLSCDLVNTEGESNAAVLLASAFPDGVRSLHVAVYDASQEPPVLLSRQVVFAGSSLLVDAPAGPSRVFAVWGEGPVDGTATHYGVAGPMDVAGGTISVPVTMRRFADTASPRVIGITIPETGTMAWNRIYGADAYEVWGRYNTSTYVPPRIMLYLGPLEHYTQGNYTNLGVKAHSALFGLVSEEGS